MKPSRKRLAALLAAAAVASGAAGCAEKKEQAVRSRVMVMGEAEEKAPPDTAVIVLTVVTQNARALEAQRQNATKTEAVIAAVRAAAGEGAEVKTSDYNLDPQRNWHGSMPRIVGYEARNGVMVTTPHLDNVGACIDAATQAGANSVEGVSFRLREGNAARGRTLAEASKQAMQKAEAMAQALGGRVVRVVEEQEHGFKRIPGPEEEQPRVASYGAAVDMTAKMSPRTPVEAGSLNVKSQVSLVVEIETDRK
ncbi:MAG TPA: SIMPL domain-containing protein [Pyrinomonadaceae bacterium]|nr:SIMPL domain-containing protein [Pyrinomonadaceae bacterium]